VTQLSTARDKTALGIVIILASVCLMSFSDAIVKMVSADLTVWQVFFARSLFAIPILLVICRVTGVSPKLKSVKWTLYRSLLLIVTWIAFYASLPVLSLSVAAVAIYTNPIITALLSALLIGEPVSKRQWSGVLFRNARSLDDMRYDPDHRGRVVSRFVSSQGL
jgi:drug/metabolite transporter (DMT)-like permease